MYSVFFRSRCLALLVVLWQPVMLRAQPSSPDLASEIRGLLADSALSNAWWGILIADLETGDEVYALNAGHSFIPASNTKLYTTAAVLDQLGPAFRYETVVYADGPVRDGVLEGNLIVRGAGDPVIGGRFNDGDRTEVFRAWADSLKAAGITRIRGDLIGDDDLFDDTPLGTGWSWDDEPYWYAAEVSGLSFNDNCVDVTLESTTPGAPARLTWEPFQTDYVRIENRSYTLPADSALVEGYERARGSNLIRLRSRVPQGQQDTESLSVSNPTLFFVHVLRQTLLRAGIAVDGRPVDVDDLSIRPRYDLPMVHRLASHTSPTMAEIVAVTNKESQNLYAEQLLRTLGALRPVPAVGPGSAERGIAAAMATFVQAGIDTTRLQLVDGSGMSRINLVTPAMTMALLRYMWHHPDEATRTAFWDSLPVGGADGTLEHRYTTDGMHGLVHAKTGTMSNASTLSGYVRSASGIPYAFVLMSNHYTVKTRIVREVQDAIVTRLVQFPP